MSQRASHVTVDEEDDTIAVGTILYMPPERLIEYGRRLQLDLNLEMTPRPEDVQQSQQAVEKAYDVFSMGIILWELLDLERLYHFLADDAGHISEKRVIESVVGGLRPNQESYKEGGRWGRLAIDPAEKEEQFAPEVSEIMKECWSHNSWDRPDFDNIQKRLKARHEQVLKGKEEAEKAEKKRTDLINAHFKKKKKKKLKKTKRSTHTGIALQTSSSFAQHGGVSGSQTNVEQPSSDYEFQRRARDLHTQKPIEHFVAGSSTFQPLSPIDAPKSESSSGSEDETEASSQSMPPAFVRTNTALF